MNATARWTVFEAAMESVRTYQHPLTEVDMRVRFSSPTGRSVEVEAFWDGGAPGRKSCRKEPARLT